VGVVKVDPQPQAQHADRVRAVDVHAARADSGVVQCQVQGAADLGLGVAGPPLPLNTLTARSRHT
jgi:hypothetical protein